MRSVLARSRLDQLGVVASGLCAAHCTLGAVLFAVWGGLGSLVEDERIEMVLLMSAVVAALVAATTGYRRHRDPRVISSILAGLLVLGIGSLVEGARLLEAGISVTAATLLIRGHARNARLLHQLSAGCRTGDCIAP